MTSRLRSDRARSPLRDRDLVEMLRERPDLLAIADALVETLEPKLMDRRGQTRVRLPRLGWDDVATRARRRRWKRLSATVAAIGVAAIFAAVLTQRSETSGGFNRLSAIGRSAELSPQEIQAVKQAGGEPLYSSGDVARPSSM